MHGFLEPSPQSQIGASFFANLPTPLKLDAKVGLGMADGNLREFSSSPGEIAVVNIDRNPQGYDKMLAIRKVGAGTVMGLNFTTNYVGYPCRGTTCEMDPKLVEFFKNILSY